MFIYSDKLLPILDLKDKNYSFLWLCLDSNDSSLSNPKWVIFFLNFVTFSEYFNFSCINLLDLKGLNEGFSVSQAK